MGTVFIINLKPDINARRCSSASLQPDCTYGRFATAGALGILGERPQIIEADELAYQDKSIRFELLERDHYFERLIFRQGEDDGAWATPVFLHDANPKAVREHIFQVLKNENFARRFPVEDQVARLYPQGVGYWCPVHKYREQSSFSLGQRISTLTSRQTYERFLGLLLKSSSDVSLARRFQRADDVEKRAYIFSKADTTKFLESLEHLKALIKCVLYAENSIWHRGTPIEWRCVGSHNQRRCRFDIFVGRTEKSITQRLESWAAVLKQFGPLKPDLSRLCFSDFFNAYPVLAVGELPAPSAHEQFEARFQLHEWARQNLPSGVWAELQQLNS